MTAVRRAADGVFGLRGIVRARRRERIGTGTWLSNAFMAPPWS